MRQGRSYPRRTNVERDNRPKIWPNLWPSLWLVLLSLAWVGLAGPARAVPAFAQQTGQPCQACHVGGFGPQLTPFGREFKLDGYTARTAAAIPISAMAVASYLHTKTDQPSAPAPGYGVNDNSALDQVSLFLAGGLGSHLGGFAQVTYDGVAKAWTWDNLDLRAVNRTQIGGHDVLLGLSANNSPTVQDAWNTLPAWGYPYTGSALAPSPTASPLLAGGLAQNTFGVTGYAWIDQTLYLEAGAYGSPSANTLTRLGADPYSPGGIDGLAPYARVAWQRTDGASTVQMGVFGMRADLWPQRDHSAGVADSYTDVGFDGSWVRNLANGDVLTVNGRYLHESQRLRATCALAQVDAAACVDNTLNDVRVDTSYYWRNRIGLTAGAFDTWGSANPVLYDGANARPDSAGLMAQVDATPWGDGHSPLGPRLNLRVGLQYTAYLRFNGAAHNYDGAGANASDNNTLRIFTWVAF